MTHSPLPNASLFLSHLGMPIETLEQSVFSHADFPDFSLPEHSPIGGVFFKKLGLSITFCPPDFYHCNDLLATLPAILTNVQLYSGDSEYHHAKYEGSLPFDLSFADDRSAVIDKLGPGAWQFPLVAPFQMERFDLLDRWILVKYADNATRIAMIQIGLKPKKPKRTVLPKILQPDIHALQDNLNSTWDQVQADHRFEGIDLSAFAIDVSGGECPHEIDALQTRGVELYFRQSISAAAPLVVLSGARYIRKGVYWSVGFDGDLPNGIRFDDTPERFLAKIGAFPVTGKADALTGYYIWIFPSYLLQIGFSVMEQRINRIYVSAHGYYSTDLITSPSLELPKS